MTNKGKPEKPTAPQRFKDHPLYQQLKPRTQRRVDEAIQAALEKIDDNVIFSAAQKEDERRWYIEEGALAFLTDIWKAQNELAEFAKIILEKRKPKGNSTAQQRE